MEGPGGVSSGHGYPGAAPGGGGELVSWGPGGELMSENGAPNRTTNKGKGKRKAAKESKGICF